MADNASNNDTMVEEFEFTIDDFSANNCGCCFLHIVNLLAKSFLKQFDAKKNSGDAGDDVELDELVTEVDQD